MISMTRRGVLLTAVSTILLSASGLDAFAQSNRSAEATRFIEQFGNQLVAIVNADEQLATKRQQMTPLVERALAVDEIGAFVLGRYWRIATPQQQQHFLRLFHAVLINNIIDKLGDFRGVGFRMTQTTERDGDYLVGTLISRPNQQPNNAQWVVSFDAGRPQIVDVLAEGTSLRLTQRSDYASFLSRNNNSIDALLNALERQAKA
ncbi:MAG: ABC transporter substrate-binding protein [Acetobacteraceae bacterium]|nr:ABC transporter substrate-binding protein [Acetobacteraceae bacterium]